MVPPDGLENIGDEDVLRLEEEETRMLFAFGPPGRSSEPGDRMGRLLEGIDHLRAVRWGEQIHGRVVATLAAEPGRHLRDAACVGRCDALMTADRGVGLVVWSADCVPILMVGDGVVAAVHSGWRGAVADIVGAVVRRFTVEYGVSPENLHAVLGPAISGPRYQVSTEIIERLGAFDLDEARWRTDDHVDLRGFLCARFESLGLDGAAIVTVGPCTASTPELASYRRDGSAAGRQWSMIYRVDEHPPGGSERHQ